MISPAADGCNRLLASSEYSLWNKNFDVVYRDVLNRLQYLSPLSVTGHLQCT